MSNTASPSAIKEVMLELNKAPRHYWVGLWC